MRQPVLVQGAPQTCGRHAQLAVAGGAFDQAATAAQHLRQYAEHVQTAVVRDVLAAGTDTGGGSATICSCTRRPATSSTGVSPRACAPPAEQQPHLAVVCTAGLVAEHDLDDEYGVDLDDLGDDHSLTRDPTVVRLREAAALLDEDVWIAVRLPDDYEGADDLDDSAATSRWATVVAHPDELGWLREALALNAEDPDGEADDDLEPLRHRSLTESGCR